MSKTELQEFFLVALPGLEDLVQAEVLDYFPELEPKLEHGGVTVMSTLPQALSMNLVLKTPTRVLWRVTRFRCRDFPKLYNKIKKFPWDDYLDPQCHLDVTVSTRLSRLSIKSRIEKTCLDAWKDFQKEKGFSGRTQKSVGLYVRLKEDECTLSLDTSGERLHKRGLRTHIGAAPLRENIAAALIRMVECGPGMDGDSGASKPVEIIDPMMGSGTFLLESAFADQPTEQRHFGFKNFVTSTVAPPSMQRVRPRITQLIGYEVDRKACDAAERNLGPAMEITQVHNVDFFEAPELPPTDSERWLFCNPPYGERLKVKEPLAQFYAKLFAACERVAKPDYACFLLPAKAVKGKFTLPPHWKVLQKRPFVNGGLPVVAFVFGRGV